MAEDTIQDRELREYRDILKPPGEFADGFNWKTVVGAFFLGVIIMPGTMYLNLFMGGDAGVGSAARWVTVILFAEVARRSLKDLKMQEVFILHYMAGLALGSPFENFLFRQYVVQSEFAQAMGIAQDIPWWWAPSAENIHQHGRTLFTVYWLAPIAMTSIGIVLSRIDGFSLGYVMYRLVSDVEELPFPMAPVGASGIIALANAKDEKEKWRWRCFSIGGMIGLAYGLIYVALPVISGAVLPRPIMLIPIPWVDFTPNLGQILPATPLNFVFDLGIILVGMVIPFWAVIGGFVGVVVTMVANPVLYKYGILHQWTPGTGFIDTVFLNSIDFYMSFGIGLTFAITLVSLGKVAQPVWRALTMSKARARDSAGAPSQTLGQRLAGGYRRLVTNNVERGDFSIFLSLGIWMATTAFWITLSTMLIPRFPWPFFVVYAIIYTPLISYASAKLEGMCGQTVDIPLIREATYILSNYRGVAIWFAPAPINNYGPQAAGFRVLELCGTKIRSTIKTLLVTTPIIVVSSLLFSHVLWTMAEVPSDAYPYAQKMWELQVKNMCLMYSSTLEGGSLFMEALRLKYVLFGLGLGTVAYMILSVLGLPTLLVFGVVRGLGQNSPGGIMFEMIGALIGRYYFKRRFGDMWLRYITVILAGYGCGMGLVAMVALAFTILSKMMQPLLY